MTTPEQDIAATARNLVRGCDRATLATASADQSWPYGSLVMTACDPDASPLLLISELAEHTRNLRADARASLLFDGTAGLDNPLTGARVTVLGRLARCDDDAARRRYLARHPAAAEYAGFGDFGVFRMAVERAHIVAGFGVIEWIDGNDFLYDAASVRALAQREADIVGHMNADHGAAVALYATALLARDGGAWTMTGIDPEGCDLRCGGAVARLAFDAPVHDAAAARAALVALAGRGREKAG